MFMLKKLLLCHLFISSLRQPLCDRTTGQHLWSLPAILDVLTQIQEDAVIWKHRGTPSVIGVQQLLQISVGKESSKYGLCVQRTSKSEVRALRQAQTQRIPWQASALPLVQTSLGAVIGCSVSAALGTCGLYDRTLKLYKLQFRDT